MLVVALGLAAGVLAAGLLAAGLLAAGLLAAGFFAADRLAAGLRAAVLRAAGFLAAGLRFAAVLRAAGLRFADDLRAAGLRFADDLRAEDLRAAGFLRPPVAVDATLRAASVADSWTASARDLPERSSCATRRPRFCTSSRSVSRVSRTRRSSIVSRRRANADPKSSKTSCTRFCAPVAPPAAPCQVRSTASRRPSVDDDFLLDFFDFLAMAREPTGAPVRLRPHVAVAERVLAPGDPGRALRLAQALTDKPLMVNHARGLWGYTGMAADGAPLTIQSTGLGGPSAAAVVRDLETLGARRMVRVGTCTALEGGPPLGALLQADPVLAADGTSGALGAGATIRPVLTGDLPAVPVASTDVDDARAPAGAHARDLTTAAVLAAAAAYGIQAGAVLVVVADAAGRRLDDDALHAAEIELAGAALAVLGSGLLGGGAAALAG